MHEVTASADVDAPPQAVYALLLDRAAVVRWSPMETCELDSPGPEDPEGVGAVRRQVMGRVVGYDTIVELVPGRLFAYTHQGLSSVREYRGRVELTPLGAGCRITWSATFAAKYPATGWILRRGVRGFLDNCVQGLAEAAAKT
ncbi:MAG: SRPBCC family protein [Stackebrandtia sp.]